MATDEIKEMLVDRYDDTTEKDWKRLSKKKYGKHEVRTFLNKQTNETFWVFGDADDEAIHPAGDHLYYLGMEENPWKRDEQVIVAAFNPLSYWQNDGCLWDQHCRFYISTIYNLPAWIELDEACENQFIVNIPKDKTIGDVKTAFETAGLIFDQAFHDYMAKWI